MIGFWLAVAVTAYAWWRARQADQTIARLEAERDRLLGEVQLDKALAKAFTRDLKRGQHSGP